MSIKKILKNAKSLGDGWLSIGRWVVNKGRWVAKLREMGGYVGSAHAAAVLWVRIQTSLKNTKRAT
jgi:hypothetical protein